MKNSLSLLFFALAGALLLPQPLTAGQQTGSMQQTRQMLQGKRLYLNWGKAEWQVKGDSQWHSLPHLGQISTLLYRIPTDKKKGSYQLPTKRYLDGLGTVPETYGLSIDYEYLPNGELKLHITDTYMRQDGLLSFDLTIKWLNSKEGEATGSFMILGPSQDTGFEQHDQQLRGIRCTLK